MHAIQNKRPLFATIGFTESRFGVKGKQFVKIADENDSLES